MSGRWNYSFVHSQASANGVNFQPTIRFVHMPHVCYDWYQPSTCPTCITGGISCSQYTQEDSDVDSHWVRILLSFLPTFLAVGSPNILKLSYANNKFLSPCNFCIHLNYFNHPENGGCMFLPYVETCNHCTAQKHKRRPLPGQQPS
jgi:hypothetical protein